MEAGKDIRRSPSKTNSKLNIGSGKLPPKREHRSSKSAAYAAVAFGSMRSDDDVDDDSASDARPVASAVDLLEPDYEGLTGSAEVGKKVPKKALSKIISRLRTTSTKTYSTLVVGDEASGPIPVLLSLIDPLHFDLKWESSSVQEGLWEWMVGDRKVVLQLFGMTLDPNLAFESVRQMFMAEVRKCDVLVLTFSLLSLASLQRAVRTHQMMTSATMGSKHGDPVVFLVGTLREMRDAQVLGSFKTCDGYHELARHYVNRGLLSTDEAKQFASGQLRLVSEAKIREAMLAVNATSYTEVCFLPKLGNVAHVFSAMAEKALVVDKQRRVGASHHHHHHHRRSKSSASGKELSVIAEDEERPDLASLASFGFPDAFIMGSDAERVTAWLKSGALEEMARPVTPRNGLSRSAYNQLLMPKPTPSPPRSGFTVAPLPRDGVHTWESGDGDVYAGHWRNHLYDGQGTLRLANGCVYTGSFSLGQFHGHGVFTSPDGASFTGSWSESKRNGKGEQRYGDGSTYVGYWRNDLRDGDGVLSFANGSTYAGSFRDDLFNGKGRYTFNTGSTYEGEWRDGKKQGQGTLHRFDGSVRKLTYQDDVLLAQETVEGRARDRAPSLRSQLQSSAFQLMTALNLADLHVDESHPLGEGYYGVVFRGTYHGVDVAVKRLRPNVPDNALAKFLTEVGILAGLRHEFIVRYLGAVFEENNLCIVTEFYGGGTLWEKIHDTSAQFTMAFVHKVCLEISSAVRYLHHECTPPIWHRDLKSPNILLTSGLHVKVADFGLAKIIQSDDAIMTTGIGTASWTAPEVLRSQAYSEKADVYSFAVIVWEMFARLPPFHPMERDQILLAVAVDDLRPAMPRDVPVVWRSFIENCWQRDASERPDFREIYRWLKDLPTKMALN